eukprot:SAG22_NODE_162_length_16848_cov_16.978267_9_plen_289_part_00
MKGKDKCCRTDELFPPVLDDTAVLVIDLKHTSLVAFWRNRRPQEDFARGHNLLLAASDSGASVGDREHNAVCHCLRQAREVKGYCRCRARALCHVRKERSATALEPCRERHPGLEQLTQPHKQVALALCNVRPLADGKIDRRLHRHPHPGRHVAAQAAPHRALRLRLAAKGLRRSGTRAGLRRRGVDPNARAHAYRKRCSVGPVAGDHRGAARQSRRADHFGRRDDRTADTSTLRHAGIALVDPYGPVARGSLCVCRREPRDVGAHGDNRAREVGEHGWLVQVSLVDA